MTIEPPKPGGNKRSFESALRVDIFPNQNDKFSMINAPESALNPPPAKQKRRGKFTLADVEAMALLVGRRKLTEHEAALKLNFKPDSWYGWKSRSQHQAKFASIVARIRGDTINHAMERIEAAGVKDWRADHARLQLLAPERFAREQNQSANVTTNNLMIAGDASQVQKLIAMFAGQVRGRVQDKPELAKLPAAN